MKKKTLFLLLPSVGLLFFTLVGFLGARWWLFDIFANFRLQYTWIAAVLLGYCWLIRIWRDRKGLIAIGAATTALVVNGWLVGSLFFPLHTSSDSANFTIMFSNIYVYNNRSSILLRYIKEKDPDVIAMAEVNSRMFAYYSRQLKDKYPYAYHAQKKRPFGVALFSKAKPTNEDIEQQIVNDALPSLKLHVVINDKPINVMVTHPYPPMNGDDFAQRNHQLLAVAGMVDELPDPTIVVGDFNMTPWSPVFKQVLDKGHLHNSMQGMGVQTSWPTWMPSPMRIPIDQALYTDGFEVVGRERGPSIGSDHKPILVKFRVE